MKIGEFINIAEKVVSRYVFICDSLWALYYANVSREMRINGNTFIQEYTFFIEIAIFIWSFNVVRVLTKWEELFIH